MFTQHLILLFIFRPHCIARGILVPWPGIELMPPGTESVES